MDAPWALIVLGAVCAGFVQGLSGFGFSLVALSFWAWALDPKLAAVLAVFGGLTGQVVAALAVRRGAQMTHVWPFIAGGLLGLPIGLWLLPRIDAVLFRVLVGGLLAVWCPLMLLSSRLPAWRRGGRMADGVAGALGGAMGPLGGFTGAVPTLWCTLRGYERDTQRAVVQNFNLTMLGITMVGYVASGVVTAPMLPAMAVVAPALLLPALAGMRLYVGISPQAFRTLVLGLLTASGLALLVNAVPQVLAR
jgi:hypothetical protein